MIILLIGMFEKPMVVETFKHAALRKLLLFTIKYQSVYIHIYLRCITVSVTNLWYNFVFMIVLSIILISTEYSIVLI
jgi:hypothetical protein